MELSLPEVVLGFDMQHVGSLIIEEAVEWVDEVTSGGKGTAERTEMGM